METHFLFLLGVIFLLGLCFGSLANVLIYRIPREIPLGLFKKTRSFCPACEKTIPFYHNLPVISYFLLKGKCASCGVKISSRYPWVEFLTALIWCFSFTVFYRSQEWDFSDWYFYGQLAVELYFIYALFVIVYIDIDFRIIPDRFSWGNWVIALAYVFIFKENTLEHILGGVFGFGTFFLLAWGYEKWRGVEGLGMGDVKMMGWLGTWVGFSSVPLLVIIASLSGSIVGFWNMRKSGEGMQTAIPFGPFLALGAYLVWLYQNSQISIPGLH